MNSKFEYTEAIKRFGEALCNVVVEVECQHCGSRVAGQGCTQDDAYDDLTLKSGTKGWYFGKVDSSGFSCVFSCLCGTCYAEVVATEATETVLQHRNMLKMWTGSA